MAKRNGGWIGAALVLGGLAALLYLERRRPLRPRVDPGAARIARNLGVAAVTAVTLAAAEKPIVDRLTRFVEHKRWGIVARLPLPAACRTAIAIALMDYTLYWWHVLMHRVPVLWRCHEPHHIDLDLDVTTALRFHFAEFLASIPWRCAQIALIGVGPTTLALWQNMTALEVMFHHANLRLPEALDRCLGHIVVTPRIHGIHHSVIRHERDSNFSSGLTLWDRLHATRHIGLDRDDVTIGVPDRQRPEDVTLYETVALPFERGVE